MDAVLFFRIIAALVMVLCVVTWIKEGYYVPHFRLPTRSPVVHFVYAPTPQTDPEPWKQNVSRRTENYNGCAERNWYELKRPTRAREL
jgi:hypothetical protein